MALDASVQDSQITALSPPLFARVQEPDGSDGSVYDIEVMAQSLGAVNLSLDDIPADLEIGGPGSDDAYRLAACTLIIGAPIGKNKVRMVDGKIENLWLNGEEATNRLGNISMLATLLSYAQKFCASHEVPHLSSIQKADHPAWLRDFFSVAGFNRCECLKPEAGSQRYRACLKLNSSDAMSEQITAHSTANNQINNARPSVEEGEIPQVKPQAPAISAKQIVTEPVPVMNGIKSALDSSKENLNQTAPITTDQALEWLAQNKEILSSSAASKLTDIGTSETGLPQSNAVLNHLVGQNGIIDEGQKSNGVKRKRDNPPHGIRDIEDEKQVSPKPKHHVQNTEDSKTRQLLEERQRAKSVSQPKPSQPSTGKQSFTVPSIPSSATRKPVKEPQPADTTEMTDALLAQVSKTSSKITPAPIKQEASTTTSRPTPPSPIDAPPQWAQNLPTKHLTCYYWATQGSCKHRDQDCTYAHWNTGNIARPPGYYTKKSRSAFFDGYDGGADGSRSDVNGIHIKGSHGAGGHASGAPTGPKAEEGGRAWDSWRPG